MATGRSREHHILITGNSATTPAAICETLIYCRDQDSSISLSPSVRLAIDSIHCLSPESRHGESPAPAPHGRRQAGHRVFPTRPTLRLRYSNGYWRDVPTQHPPFCAVNSKVQTARSESSCHAIWRAYAKSWTLARHGSACCKLQHHTRGNVS